MNFLKLLRPNKNVISNTLLNTARGAKRKGEKKEAGVLSEHVLNVFKNAPEDVAILPDQYYPKWVLELHREPMRLEEMYGNAILGVTIPSASDQFTMLRKQRRKTKFKEANKLRHLNAPFDKDWENMPEGDENQIDVEWGMLTQTMEDIAKEEMKKIEAQEGGQQGGGGAKKESSE